ncbi:hypothetical protein ACIO13_28450 [Streptomyces sp. NPDC087425]|uniref:hypothetical protein n=1 Tax=Streptomyces sp. NPDC087425 TaxID=3365787 RepID=UPI00382999CD
MNPRIIVADSVKDPDAGIWFAVPGGFTEVPLDVLLARPMSPEVLNTTAVERREQYRVILKQIAELTSFESPLAEA